MGLRRVVEREEEERVPVEFRWDTSKFCHNWLRSKVSQSIVKLFLTFLKVKHCKGGGSTVGGPKAATKAAAKAKRSSTNCTNSRNKHQQQQRQRQQRAATGTQATTKAATSSRIRSSTNSNPEKVRAKRCGSRRWEGVFPWNFGCVRGFSFWMQAKFVIIGC